MSFNFNFDDDELPFDMEEIARLIQNMQKQIMKQLKEQGFDLEQMDLSAMSEMMKNNPNMKRFGFSIHQGPDGRPHIQPLDGQNIPFEMPQQTKGSGFEEPFVDTFFSKETGEYQIIAEVTGVEDADHVHLKLDGNDLTIHAETGPFKYRKSMLLKHPIDEDTMEFSLRNGVLEITAKAK